MELTLAQAFLILFSPYELLTICLYIRIIFVIAKCPEFNRQPFYRLIFIMGILDLLHMTVEIVFFRLSFFPPIAQIFLGFEKARWISMVNFVMYATTYMQFFMHLAITVNRFSALFAPMRHDKIWNKFFVRIISAFLSITFLLCSDRIFSRAIFFPFYSDQPTKLLFPWPIEFEYYQFDQSLITIIFGAFTCLACLVLNFSTLMIYRRLKKENKLNPQNGMRIELNLVLSAVFMMVPQFLMTTFHVFLEFLLSTTGVIDNPLLFYAECNSIWVYDFYSLSQPWILLFVCSELKTKAILELFPKRKPKNEIVILFTVVNQARSSRSLDS